MMHAFAAGELLRDPERKTASNGNAYTTALLKVDADTVVSLTAFDATLAERLAALRKGGALACSGRLQARPYQDKDGTLRAGLSVTVTELMTAATPPAKAAPRPRRDRARPSAGDTAGHPFDDGLEV